MVDRPLVLFVAARDARLLYVALSHLVCSISHPVTWSKVEKTLSTLNLER
jgi:hypothetical protein